ncbi:PREDICTED: F-box/FBD/LRR-repeat protein At1g13570-like [Ipomoea nil]|uniref:F-box/FBD/LRR-repeat protein At1g13570-like n=1 Tax=Ipomoea nil TaxID=35883 RepID=UPI0009011BE8|nr:PREDICTED: F-box/FBD/LRR-repeat protein At1g13570-like [Ipomoea nil]XP_019149950.1 PREDICTED: F-box/FBD/LRR-repeat protein At1g13570-like [Ipomoea nil]
MGRRRLIKTTVADASRDLISPLPVEIKHRILECLPTQDAARTALLSNHWNDVWLQHGRLAFDCDFTYSVDEGHDDEGRTLVDIINDILLSRAGPVKKFTLGINNYYPELRQSDFNRWCLFLSRNGVEELNIGFFNRDTDYKLPFCILSCPTIKQLSVDVTSIDLPVNNVGGIFSNVTSLFFQAVEFRRTVNGTASSISIPNLERLNFLDCVGITKFEISASKLEMLSVRNSVHDVVDSRWLTPHLKAIKALWLCDSSLPYMDASLFATAINLQVLGLDDLSFGSENQLAVVMQLLQKCPNLCELGIMADQAVCKRDIEAASSLLEDLDGCFIVQDLKMLNTIKIESFNGSTNEMLFVKLLLSNSPALEKVVIMEYHYIDRSVAVRSQRELLRFPRASPKAQIICMEHDRSMLGWAMGELWSIGALM